MGKKESSDWGKWDINGDKRIFPYYREIYDGQTDAERYHPDNMHISDHPLNPDKIDWDEVAARRNAAQLGFVPPTVVDNGGEARLGFESPTVVDMGDQTQLCVDPPTVGDMGDDIGTEFDWAEDEDQTRLEASAVTNTPGSLAAETWESYLEYFEDDGSETVLDPYAQLEAGGSTREDLLNEEADTVTDPIGPINWSLDPESNVNQQIRMSDAISNMIQILGGGGDFADVMMIRLHAHHDELKKQAEAAAKNLGKQFLGEVLKVEPPKKSDALNNEEEYNTVMCPELPGLKSDRMKGLMEEIMGPDGLVMDDTFGILLKELNVEPGVYSVDAQKHFLGLLRLCLKKIHDNRVARYNVYSSKKQQEGLYGAAGDVGKALASAIPGLGVVGHVSKLIQRVLKIFVGDKGRDAKLEDLRGKLGIGE